jgi:hypothetical protein
MKMSCSPKRTILAVFSLLALTLTAIPAFAESYTVSWNPVSTYSDGSAFEAGKTVTYTVYWTTDASLSAASLKAIASSTAATSATFDPTVAGMTRGNTAYFTVKSILNTGEESALAAGVAWVVPKKTPGTPGGTKIIRL